jgi:predicted nucleic acid-binding protein
LTLTAVLDAWAIVALLKAEPSAARVRAVIEEHDSHACSINLGEAYCSLIRSHGDRLALERVERIRHLISVHDPIWTVTRDAAEIKARGGLSYADAFCVATARWRAAPLYTGDDEILRLTDAGVELVDLRRSR